MNINDLKKKTISELINIAKELNINDVGRVKKQEIIFAILNGVTVTSKVISGNLGIFQK